MESDHNFSVKAAAAPVRKQVEDNLRDAIITGRFAPGEHLSDRLLCELFKVSRPVVREAVRQLEAEGLVETTPHRGSFVKIITVEEATQIYEVRGVLEAQAARAFARNATDAEINELKQVFDQISEFHKSSTRDGIVELKQSFYEILLRGSRNTYVTRMLNQILNQNTRLRAMSLSDPRRLKNTVKELDVLMQAIMRRDEEAAWHASLNHVNEAARVALKILSQKEPGTDDVIRQDYKNEE